METMDRDTRTERSMLNEAVERETLCLVEGRPYAAVLSGPVTIEVLDGAVWATLEGDRDDHAVSGGERCGLRGEGLLVIEALTPFAHLRVIAPGTRATAEARRGLH